MLRIDPLNPALTGGQPRPHQQQRAVSHPDDATRLTGRARCRRSTPTDSAIRIASRFDRDNGQLIVADVGQNNIEEIDRVVLGGNYGWAIKEGDYLFNRSRHQDLRRLSPGPLASEARESPPV